jgi:integrase
LTLRIKDIDLDRGEIKVRAGKGNKDRITMIPNAPANKRLLQSGPDASAHVL